MNCANHPATAAVAYCRTCGKPLCQACTRDVKGVIYCENCLADRLSGVQPAVAQPLPGATAAMPPARSGSGPNPAVAGILAGFFPFGVGAVYCGQYAKGLAHLLVFFGLCFGASNAEGIEWLFGLGIAFFYVWQIIDAVRTAHALQAGLPAPDPLGLGQAFGAGEKVDTSKVPVAAVVLIGLGGLFLLQTMGVFEFSIGRIAPVFCILLGLWLFAKRFGWLPSRTQSYQVNRFRGLTGPVVLVTLGLLSLIEDMGGPRWHRTWPILLLAIGITKLLERQAAAQLPPPPAAAGGTDQVQPPPSEVQHG